MSIKVEGIFDANQKVCVDWLALVPPGKRSAIMEADHGFIAIAWTPPPLIDHEPVKDDF